jgi:hypothetical protein
LIVAVAESFNTLLTAPVIPVGIEVGVVASDEVYHVIAPACPFAILAVEIGNVTVPIVPAVIIPV